MRVTKHIPKWFAQAWVAALLGQITGGILGVAIVYLLARWWVGA